MGKFEFKTSLFPPYDQNIECQKNPHPEHTDTFIKCNCFYAPEIEDREAYCFCPVCHSVILSETLTLLITFDQ